VTDALETKVSKEYSNQQLLVIYKAKKFMHQALFH
jgi:hypothetical protein